MTQFTKHHIQEETDLFASTVLVVQELPQGIWSPGTVYLVKMTCSNFLSPESVKEEL
jgi:hypothetical protein